MQEAQSQASAVMDEVQAERAELKQLHHTLRVQLAEACSAGRQEVRRAEGQEVSKAGGQEQCEQGLQLVQSFQVSYAPCAEPTTHEGLKQFLGSCLLTLPPTLLPPLSLLNLLLRAMLFLTQSDTALCCHNLHQISPATIDKPKQQFPSDVKQCLSSF